MKHSYTNPERILLLRIFGTKLINTVFKHTQESWGWENRDMDLQYQSRKNPCCPNDEAPLQSEWKRGRIEQAGERKWIKKYI